MGFNTKTQILTILSLVCIAIGAYTAIVGISEHHELNIMVMISMAMLLLTSLLTLFRL
jgi:hypothetical protein